MSHGKDAARDLRYGRRGGGWVAPDDGKTIDDVRNEAIAAGTWPDVEPTDDDEPPSLFD